MTVFVASGVEDKTFPPGQRQGLRFRDYEPGKVALLLARVKQA
jgi:hypothetical protein